VARLQTHAFYRGAFPQEAAECNEATNCDGIDAWLKGNGHGGLSLISEGAGEIAKVHFEDFVFGVEFVLDGGEGAEEEVAGVGHDGSAAGGGCVEMQEAREEIVDGDGGFEFNETAGEKGGDVALLQADSVGDSVFGANARGDAGDGVAATAACGSAMLATGQIILGNGVHELFVHGWEGFGFTGGRDRPSDRDKSRECGKGR
jgi:hypothetical protein